MPKITFSSSLPGADRMHYVKEEEVRVLLDRLPAETWTRLRAVHFNDQSRGARSLGYVNPRRREIALCALPPRISLTRFLVKGQTPEQFGAKRGQKWPVTAVRRFMLYDVFLHELGHMQLIDENTCSARLKYGHEKLAQAFALQWCRRFRAERFSYPDPVHNPPTPEEFASFQI